MRALGNPKLTENEKNEPANVHPHAGGTVWVAVAGNVVNLYTRLFLKYLEINTLTDFNFKYGALQPPRLGRRL